MALIRIIVAMMEEERQQRDKASSNPSSPLSLEFSSPVCSVRLAGYVISNITMRLCLVSNGLGKKTLRVVSGKFRLKDMIDRQAQREPNYFCREEK